MCADMYIGSADGRNATSAYSDLNLKEARRLWDTFAVFLAGFREEGFGEPLRLMGISTGKERKTNPTDRTWCVRTCSDQASLDFNSARPAVSSRDTG